MTEGQLSGLGIYISCRSAQRVRSARPRQTHLSSTVLQTGNLMANYDDKKGILSIMMIMEAMMADRKTHENLFV